MVIRRGSKLTVAMVNPLDCRVFPGEACDDLGGEFCEAPYQDGVSKELAHA